MPRALLSVSDKSGIVDVARGLAARGYELFSTGGTSRTLTEAGLPVTSVSSLTGFPEMMDGRVKTLHPALHGGILARRDRPDDMAELERHGLGLVDLVVVNLYPFVKAAANPATPFDALLEEIDIGGTSPVRPAGKALPYTTLPDLDAAARLVLESHEPAAAVIKHTNPCGAATGDSLSEAYLRARDADSLAAFGGIVALNRTVDVATATLIVSTFI